ncbi:PadR family transcriptional regulator [Hoyosella subflava]|uniref:Putative transcriptional regulator n=1 Tax=Hoyosella subflava (strain DSM 45089 / JCM 17490 / NBRC 109087 / DQS3-9A1) TaxID=443218 RepID=F6EJH4_HOYSD|nr:PadR family transcriptional regulator [Hoyosella subflava]AEF39023.1 Putative transcriptional regulator [Hoyosella subflava DQS3-9A1]
MARHINSTAAALLGFLHQGPLSGWDLAAIANERIGDFWTVTRSQVYRELSSMAEAGLVSRGEAGARERVPYSITDEGKATFREWITREPGSDTIRVPMLLTLTFGEHLQRADIEAILERHRKQHEVRLAGYMKQADAGVGSPYGRATLEFGILYEKAVLEWFERVPGILDAR